MRFQEIYKPLEILGQVFGRSWTVSEAFIGILCGRKENCQDRN